MITAALLDKLRQRGPIGFAADAAELALACAIISGWAALVSAAGWTGVVAAAPLGVLELLTRRRQSERPHRCDADCASDRTVCEAPVAGVVPEATIYRCKLAGAGHECTEACGWTTEIAAPGLGHEFVPWGFNSSLCGYPTTHTAICGRLRFAHGDPS